jgi:hypothetical protein
LRFLLRFQTHFGVKVLTPSILARPVQTPAIPLVWSELYYSLRQTKGDDGLFHPICFALVRPLRSAAALYYTLDMQAAYPRQVMRDRHLRGLVQPYVSPTDELCTSFGASGMARQMGMESKKSWANRMFTWHILMPHCLYSTKKHRRQVSDMSWHAPALSTYLHI